MNIKKVLSEHSPLRRYRKRAGGLSRAVVNGRYKRHPGTGWTRSCRFKRCSRLSFRDDRLCDKHLRMSIRAVRAREARRAK